jgi:hypothetical protein
MGILAMEHIIVNFDAYGHEIGKNMYAYKPDDGRWQLYMFDLDWLMLAAPGRIASYAPSTASLFTPTDDPTMTRMYNHPPFRRAYFRTVQRSIAAMDPAVVNPVMDAKYQSLVANGITRCDGQALTDPAAVKTWFSQRRTYLINQLNGLAAPFAVTSNNGTDFNTDSGSITLTGTAPVEVAGLRVNGADFPVMWSSITNWNLTLNLWRGANALTIEAYDYQGRAIAALSDKITITSSTGTTPPRVVINEWMAANTSTLADPADNDWDDWIELYNPNAVPVDLSNWQLSDTLSDPARRWSIPAGQSIPANGYLLIWADEEFAQNTSTNLDLHANFKLSQAGEVIGLFSPDGRLVDSISFTQQTANVSQGRLPNGAETIQLLPTPTPRAVNEAAAIRVYLEPGAARLQWNATVGAIYKVLYKDEITDPAWTELLTINSTGATAVADIGPFSQSHRFFRVQRLP